jgi:uncharacterized membrane protein
MAVVFLAFLIGVTAGLRAFMAPAAISWAAHDGALDLQTSRLAFMGYGVTKWIFTLLAAVELVTDQLPSTPSRKVPPQFAARMALGALSGATIGSSAGMWLSGMLVGIAGAVAGTLGGAALRARMAAAFGSDRPAALIEDAIAIGAALCIARSWGAAR